MWTVTNYNKFRPYQFNLQTLVQSFSGMTEMLERVRKSEGENFKVTTRTEG